MFIIRRTWVAQPGRRDETVALAKEMMSAAQKELGVSFQRLVTASIGPTDSTIEMEGTIASLSEFESQLQKMNSWPTMRTFETKLRQEVNNFFNLIPHCIAIGEAAGTAAALALKQGVTVREVDFAALRKQLIAQNVILPDAYPEKYKKQELDRNAVFEVPFFGEWQVPKGDKKDNLVKPEH